MSVSYLAARIPWLGGHSGYERLVDHVQAAVSDVRVLRARTAMSQIRLGRWYCLAKRWHGRDDYVSAAAELRFALATWWRRRGIRHLLYAEAHHHHLERWSKAPPGVVGTIHHPPVQWHQWSSALPDNLARLSSAVVLYRADLEHWRSLLGDGRVVFIPHGVDVTFFRPPEARPAGRRRLLFAGQNGRNTKMLQRVVVRLARSHPDLGFDLLVRRHVREVEGLRELRGHPQVEWHEGLTDRQLRDLYQRSYLVLLPFDCCGASNALVEALASGLPVVTTDVGGVPDYGGGRLYPAVKNDDDDAMVEAVDSLLDDDDRRNAMGAACREFATRELAWPLVMERHLEAYAAFLNGKTP